MSTYMKTPAHEAATEYVALGWHPLPMKPKSKEPAAKFKHLVEQDFLVPHIPREEYFAQEPGAGVAILVRPSHLLVVDCDSAAAVQEAIENTPERCNNIVLTSKGAHFYYRRPEHCPPLRTVQRGASQKIDIMADGYMIAPPSVHPSGHRYRWISQGPLQEAPAWAVGLLSAIREKVAASLSPEAFAQTEPVDMYRVRMLNPLVHDLVTGKPNPGLARFGDRSTALWLVMNTLHRLGYSPGTIYATVWASPVGEKARERGSAWLVGEIERVVAQPRPEPPPPAVLQFV